MVADQELETVFVPDDPTQLALAESVLRKAGISYAAQNSELQNLFGAGEVGGYNPAIGAVAIQVAASDLERTRELLAEALGEEAVQSGQLALAENESSQLVKRFYRYSIYSLAWGILWFGGLGSLLAIYFGLKALSLRREMPDLRPFRAVWGLAVGVLGLLLCLTTWGSSFFKGLLLLG